MYGNFINLDLQHKNIFFEKVTKSLSNNTPGLKYVNACPTEGFKKGFKYISQSLFYYFKEFGPSPREHFLFQQTVSSTLHILSFSTVWKALVLLPTFNNNQYPSQFLVFIGLFYWTDS